MPSVSKRFDLAAPSNDKSLATTQLVLVLGIVAGSVDVIGFLALNGLFTAHVTGNIVTLAARLVAGSPAPVAHLLAIPVFIVALGSTGLLAAWLQRANIPSLLPLLLLELLLLSGFFGVSQVVGPRLEPDAAGMIFAGMLGVSAMAVQNALVRISLTGAPSTAVMTTNITVFTLDLGEILLAQDAISVARARERLRSTGIAIAGFILGCALGAACEYLFGLSSLAAPICLLLAATALGLVADVPQSRRS